MASDELAAPPVPGIGSSEFEPWIERNTQYLEVDAVVQAADGRWAAFEIKLGAGCVDEGARNLLKFAGRVDQAVCGAPSSLGMIVATGYGYRRPDGVGVIPVTALGP